MSKPAYPDIEKMTFEQALAELENIVSQIDKGQLPLAQAIDSYSRGMALRTHCEKLLGDAKLKIEQLNPNEQTA